MPRVPCPFYGFHTALLPGGPVLTDQGGNQCALRAGYAPCLMEINGAAPVWRDCEDCNTDQNRNLVQKLRAVARIFPVERPPEGVSLDVWFRERTEEAQRAGGS